MTNQPIRAFAESLPSKDPLRILLEGYLQVEDAQRRDVVEEDHIRQLQVDEGLSDMRFAVDVMEQDVCLP